MKLVFATQNQNKLKEVQELMPEGIELVSLNDIGHEEELEETAISLDGNARQKAEFIYRKYNMNCFADDTGLEIDALDGAPGVYSARYAGAAKDATANMMKVLDELSGNPNREAQFRTAICLFWKDKMHTFDGVVRGSILENPVGDEGFGYDPIFAPEGETRSFAEMTSKEKNERSHRGRAIAKLVDWLSENA
ncbi:MAG: non-canonical purine NTP diphosphatase [Flavobacteriia bacterium]|nr:non-canonical purine NTP diphosphatase [Flavobacteriia bacterium]